MFIMISFYFKGLRTTLLDNAMAVYMIPRLLLLFDTLGAEAHLVRRINHKNIDEFLYQCKLISFI